MNGDHLVYFLTAADMGSMRKASAALNVSRTAVAAGIKKLEVQAGGKLMVPDSRQGVILTPFGCAFYERAKSIVEGYQELASLKEENVPSMLRLALCVSHFDGMDQVIVRGEQFLRDLLDLPVRIAAAPIATSLDALRCGQIDALITVGEAESADLDCIPIGALPTGVVVRSGHPAVRFGQVSLADLANYPVMASVHADTGGVNKTVLITYRERGLASPVRMVRSKEEFEGLLSEDAYAFTAIVPFLDAAPRGRGVVPIVEEDALPIPICVGVLRERKTLPGISFERLARSLPTALEKGLSVVGKRSALSDFAALARSVGGGGPHDCLPTFATG